MRVLHLLKHSVDGNGGVHVAVDLACEHADRGHAVAIASSGGRYDELLRDHGVKVVTIPRAESIRDTLSGLRTLLEVTRRFRPDVLHAHMMSSAVQGAVVSQALRVPMVTTVHNSFDPHSKLMRLGRTVVAVSEAERELLVSRGFPRSKVITVLNGADGSARESLEGADLGALHTPGVMTLSGLHPRKAVDDVIAAFALVLPDHPTWHLNIVGGGPDKDRLVDLVDQRGLSRNVHFLGSTLTPRYLLDQAAIYATATRADPCPLSVAEARAAGCAIVATEVGGIPQLLDGGRAGRMVPPGEPQQMAREFDVLMSDPSALAAARGAAVEGADHLTVRRMAEDYLHVYRGAGRGPGLLARVRRPRVDAGPVR